KDSEARTDSNADLASLKWKTGVFRYGNYILRERQNIYFTDKKYNISDAGGSLWIFVTSILREENRWMYGLSSDIL
ncbi:hypothetical protein LI322_27990, partial [Bacteroides cellulosilyticus]|uniref:hypothetical protein n=1 Tax=Bacteroides cellulosilyticus TaxID=246787 RepID=UPI001D05D397